MPSCVPLWDSVFGYRGSRADLICKISGMSILIHPGTPYSAVVRHSSLCDLIWNTGWKGGGH